MLRPKGRGIIPTLIKKAGFQVENNQSLIARFSWKKADIAMKESLECDLSAFMLNDKDVLRNKDDAIFYNIPKHQSKSLRYLGHTMEGDKEIEELQIVPIRIPEEYKKILIFASIYDASKREQNFSMLKEPELCIIDEQTREVLLTYDVEVQEETTKCVFLCTMTNENEHWYLQIDGEEQTEHMVGVLGTYFCMRKDWRSDYNNQ